MANKNVNILLTLKDQFTPKLKGTTAEIKKQKAQINASSKVIKKWGQGANNTFKSVMSTAGKVAGTIATLGGALSVAGLVNFANQAIEGFNAAQLAETKLEAVLKNVPSIMAQGADAAAQAKDRLVALSDQMEEYGVVAGDVSVAGLQQLATFQLTEDSLKAGPWHGGPAGPAKGRERHPRGRGLHRQHGGQGHERPGQRPDPGWHRHERLPEKGH